MKKRARSKTRTRELGKYVAALALSIAAPLSLIPVIPFVGTIGFFQSACVVAASVCVVARGLRSLKRFREDVCVPSVERMYRHNYLNNFERGVYTDICAAAAALCMLALRIPHEYETVRINAVMVALSVMLVFTVWLIRQSRFISGIIRESNKRQTRMVGVDVRSLMK